jgi:large subunit ribosomal protein L18e
MKKMKKNPSIARLIQYLNAKDAPIWKDIANRLEKRLAEVNIGKIQRCVNDGEIALVPGKVLGMGEIKAVTIAGLKFSKKAREKIANAGGKCLSIYELAKENPKGNKIRIFGG